MDNKLFFVGSDKTVKRMNAKLYDKESELQEIVELNPNLISRAWDDREHDLYLINREQIVQASEDEGNSFSLDHLLVDDEGVPILVEVKRSTDTRIRREVVAQMLDYACRASSWDCEQLREMFIKNNPAETELFDNSDFWNRFSANLRAEHFRLVFVADKILDTLRILIEFLDRNLSNIEVYGVELKPYKTDEATLLVSNIVGNSLLSPKASPSIKLQRQIWTEPEFYRFMNEHGLASLVETVMDLVAFSKNELGLSCTPGTGSTQPGLRLKMGDIQIFSIDCWVRQARMICTINFYINEKSGVQTFAGRKWDKEAFRSFVLAMPNSQEAEDAGYIWRPNNYQYIDVSAFMDSAENYDYIKNVLREIVSAVSNAENENL